MKRKSLLGPLLLLLALASGPAAGEDVADPKKVKQLLVDVERIRRLEPREQTKEVDRLYRTLAPRAGEFRYHLRQREFDYLKDRDKLTPEAWVEKAWTSFPDAFMYLLWDARAECYALLKKQQAVLQPLIVADLASKKEKEVKWALQVVGEVGGKELFEPVLEVFKKNAACSNAAIYALRGIDDPRAIAALVERHPDLLAVSSVLRGLQAKRPADPALVALLDSRDAKVRAYAASALAESGDATLVERIEKLLRDEDPQVRSGAANMGLCLEKEAYQRIRPAIVALARDPDPGVKRFVVMCLAQRRDPACGPALLEMARDTKLTHQEHYEVVRRIHDLTHSEFGYDTSATGWRPSTAKNRAALHRFAEWVEKNSRQE